MKNKLLIEVRDALELHLKSLPQTGVLPSSHEIASQFRKSNPELIKNASEPLLDVVLAKFVSDVSARKSHRSWTSSQSELFGRLTGIPNIIRISTASGKRRHVSLTTPSATLDQIMSWFENEKERRSRKSRYTQFNTLVKILKPHFKDGHTTLEDAMKAARKDPIKFKKALSVAGLGLELLSA